MADLLQLDFVVKEVGLEKALTQTAKFEREIMKTVKAYQKGQITQDRYQKSLLNVKRQMADLTNENGKHVMSIHKANAHVQKFIASQNTLNSSLNAGSAAVQQTARKTNQLGVLMQQTGYQVGDFAVQVQSGTNVMVALGQQATQLVGTFAMLARSTAAIAAFSALGVIVPIVTAIAGAFMRTAKSAEEAKNEVTGLAKTLKDFRQEQRAFTQGITTDQLALQDRIRAIKELREEQLQLIKDLQSNANASDIMNVDLSVAERLSALIGEVVVFDPKKQADAEGIINTLNDLMDKALDEQRELQIKINTEYLKRVRSMEDAIKLASIENRFGQDHVKYRNEVRRQAEVALELEIKQAGITEHVARKLRDRLKTEYDIIDAKADQDELDRLALARQEAITNSTKAALAVANQMTTAIEEREEAVKEIQKTHNDELKNLKDQIDLIRVEAQYGKDSVQLEKVKAALAREAYEQSRIDAGIKGNLLKVEMETYDELQRQKETLADINEEERQRLLLVKEQLKFYERQAERQMRLNQSPMFINTDSLDAAAKIYKDRLKEIEKGQDKAAKAAEKLNDKIRDLEDAADPFRAYNRELKELDKMLDKNQISQKAYNKAVDDLNEGLGDSIQIIGDVEQAFSDWLANGMRDFKGFVSSIKDMFIRLLADLAAQAVRNRILIPITAGFAGGAGSAAAAGTAGGIVAGGGIGATLAAGAFGLGQGVSAALGMGGFTSAGLFNVSANAAVATAAGASPMMATIGAAIPPLIAVAAVIGLLTKKTKVLDTGLRATVEGFDVAIQSFQLTQTSRLFGLLKGKKVTSYGAAPSAIAAPIVEAIGGIQQSVLDAAKSLGIGTGLFEDFSYKFQVSLQGLTEEQKMQKLNEELSKMGDAFASLSGHFETMNELLQVAQQRYDLETRLLTLLNDQSALLTRQRQIERATTHELNQGTLDQIYALEDAYRGVNTAFATAQRSIEARKKAITNSFNEVMESIQSRVQAASQAVSLSQSILSSLQSAAGRGIGMSREAGLSYLRSLTGQARITDQEALSEALSAVGEPSEDLYSSFVDYQREFADQSNLIRDLEEKAGKQLSADEKLLKQLQEQERATEGRHNAQLSALDAQLSKAQAQIDALNNVDTSVKSVSEAMSDLAEAIKSAQATQAEAKASSAAATGGGSKAVAQFGGDLDLLSKYDMGSNYTRTSDNKTFDRIKLTGASQLLDAASMVGVSTTGKTGAQISQAIANAGYVAVNLDSATKAQQFALGGYHSGGLRMVGERGPELEATGPSRVYSANQTRRMMQNPDLVEAVKAMKEEIVELRNEQRQLGINNNKYTKRTYDLYRQWDTEGLPAERT